MNKAKKKQLLDQSADKVEQLYRAYDKKKFCLSLSSLMTGLVSITSFLVESETWRNLGTASLVLGAFFSGCKAFFSQKKTSQRMIIKEELRKKSFRIFDELEMGRIDHLFDMRKAEDNCGEKEAMDTAAAIAKLFGVFYDSESTRHSFEGIFNVLLNSVPLLVPFGEAILIALEKVEGSRVVWSVTVLGISCVWDFYRMVSSKSK